MILKPSPPITHHFEPILYKESDIIAFTDRHKSAQICRKIYLLFIVTFYLTFS